MAYDTNLKTALTGTFGDNPPVKNLTITGRGNLDDAADIRDVMSAMVGKGITDFTNPNVKDYLTYLSSKVGIKQAQQMFTHIILFNQRPDVQGKSPEQKINQFYSMGASDSNLDNIIKGAGSLGSGPVSGARDSSDVLNMQAVGKNLGTESNDLAAVNTVKSIASKKLN